MFLNKPCLILFLLMPLVYMTDTIASTNVTPIKLSADQITYHDKTHTSEYRYQVKIQYANSEFSGAYMVVKHTPHQPPNELTITGKPVLFKIHSSPNQARISGHAQSITLLPKKNLAILHGNASIINGIEILKSNTIRYHLSQKKNTVKNNHIQTKKHNITPHE